MQLEDVEKSCRAESAMQKVWLSVLVLYDDLEVGQMTMYGRDDRALTRTATSSPVPSQGSFSFADAGADKVQRRVS